MGRSSASRARELQPARVWLLVVPLVHRHPLVPHLQSLESNVGSVLRVVRYKGGLRTTPPESRIQCGFSPEGGAVSGGASSPKKRADTYFPSWPPAASCALPGTAAEPT